MEISDFESTEAYIKWHSETKTAALDQAYIDMMIRQKGEAWVAQAIEFYEDTE